MDAGPRKWVAARCVPPQDDPTALGAKSTMRERACHCANPLAQTKSTMNLGHVTALPFQFDCKHVEEALHSVKTIN